MKSVKETNLISICDLFASFTSNLTYDDLPKSVINAVKRAVIDTIGVTVGALVEKDCQVVTRYVKNLSKGKNGTAAVFGQGYRTLPELAALANATLAHLLDFDDSHNPMGGHPSAPLVPTVLAMAEHTKASGKDLILAYAIGFEIETKLSRVVNPRLYQRGWHPTSVLSIFATTAAAASLLKLSEEETAYALATAASFCGGIKGNFGTLTKSLHVGKAAQSGIQAAYLAYYGNTANRGIFEAEMGFLDLYCSEDSTNWRLENIGKLGEDWDIINPGITVKPYPCCGSTHSTIDGHLEIREKYNIEPSDIAWIRNAIHERRIPHTNRPKLKSGLEGKFSNQYVTALVWTKGFVSLDHFNDQTYKDATILDLMSKIKFTADLEISKTSHETHALVEIGLKDGQIIAHKVTKRKGSPQNPLSDKELEDKFRYCTQRVYNHDWIHSVLLLLNRIEELADITLLTERLEEPPIIR